MSKHLQPDPSHTRSDAHAPADAAPVQRHLPNRLMTVFEVAEFVGCHEESVRRAYLCGQLKRQRFGVRSWRFHPGDVQDWIARGAPTRIS
jgi:excisionase family DNA binding protein